MQKSRPRLCPSGLGHCLASGKSGRPGDTGEGARWEDVDAQKFAVSKTTVSEVLVGGCQQGT
ncbi:hypothetical protein CSUI_008478 [Cystoisospora suis]|uniref:Uncharacterized protein n=1 Tax=Cystoisospora suis TaxID=483139 RepID=A0A2C6KMH3_9APIC|nr:hypothetical protein CSUI_008478 [Cystoisospora suis]